MASIVFNEWYGEVTRAQQAAYRKHNVSPSDHDELVEVFGADNHAAITEAVKAIAAKHGSFSTYYLRHG